MTGPSCTPRREDELTLRGLLGKAFQPPALDRRWLTPAAKALAGEMEATRDFSAMPVLADALEDAGCDNADVLSHCRAPGPHVQGCWVVAMLLEGPAPPSSKARAKG